MEIYCKSLSCKPIRIPTNEKHTIHLKTRSCVRRLGMTEVNFHHDSVVLLPDDVSAAEENKYSGLKALAACFIYSNENIDQSLMIVGHTDRSGPEAYNEILSEKRARNVFYALTGKRSEWTDSCLEKHNVEDYQYILKWLSNNRNWNTDPGDVDNINGPKTKAGVTRFQEQYNTEYNKVILCDGIVGKQTWGAFYDVYLSVLGELLGIQSEELKSRQGMFTFLDPAVIGCGERFPGTSDGTGDSTTDRRVELLFFETGEEPEKNDVSICEQLYSRNYYQFEPINCPMQSLKNTDKVTVRDEADVMLAHTRIACTLDDGSEVIVRTDSFGNARVWGKTIASITVDDVHTLDTI